MWLSTVTIKMNMNELLKESGLIRMLMYVFLFLFTYLSNNLSKDKNKIK